MIALVEGAERQKTPNEIALNILLAGLTIIFLLAVVTLAAIRHLLRIAADRVCAGVAAGLPDSDHHRRTAVGHRHRRHGPPDSAQRARHVRTRRRSRRRRQHAAAGQDRHHHARQSPGSASSSLRQASARRRWPTPRSFRRWRTKLRKAARSSSWQKRSMACAAASLSAHEGEFVPFTAQTRMSGVNLNGFQIRKGAADAITKYLAAQRRARCRPKCRRRSSRLPARAARRWWSRKRAAAHWA